MSPLIPLWHGETLQAFPHPGGARGFIREACTKTGRHVKVWVGAPSSPDSSKYFCHGHALGTYQRFGYSVFSGDELQNVLRDEWNLVGNVHHGQAGDIVVWHGVHKGFAKRFADHSAKIVSVATRTDGQADLDRTILSSKNGTLPLEQAVSLARLVKMYGSVYALYRHK